MLLTDSDIIATADLTQVDSEAAAVAASTKPAIVLDGPGSICEQAWRECGQKLLSAMQLYSTYLAQPGMTGGHLSAVLNVGVPARTQPRVRLNQIVAHEQNYAGAKSAIELWMAYTALTLLYRDAANRLSKDRYEEKAVRYNSAASERWNELRSLGLPMIYQPLEAPGAKHSFRAGSWSAANLSAIDGGSNAEPQNVVVAITWYDASKYSSQGANGNAESAPSEIVPFTIDAEKLLQVDITSLNPPTGAMDAVGTAQGTWLPLTATHWNLWVGQPAQGTGAQPVLYLQHAGIPVATKTYALVADPVYSGSVMGQGQWPDLNICFQNLVMRG